MMDEQPYLSEPPASSETPPESDGASRPPASRRRRVLIGLSILFNCVMCLGLGLLVVHIFNPQQALSQDSFLPVTGGDVTPEPATAAPDTPTPAPSQDSGGPAMPFAKTYHDTAVDRLSICMSSFHDFFLMEELAARQPDLMQNDGWTKSVTTAVKAFRSDCEALGSLPDAPASYAELDRWLKLAATEVTQAADSFNAVLTDQHPDDLRKTSTHLMRFVHYAQNAEDLLNSLEDRREI